MKLRRYPLFSAEGLLLRAFILVAAQIFLMWFLAGENVVAVLLAPSTQSGYLKTVLAMLFMMTRLFSIYIAPGLIGSCLALLLMRGLQTRRKRALNPRSG